MTPDRERVKETPALAGRSPFTLGTERLGPLPLVNHFLERMGLAEILERFVPTDDRRVALPYAKGLLVLLRSVVVEREPIYRQHETVRTFAPAAYGLSESEVAHLDADRAALLTEVIVSVARRFELRFDRLHNDSTTVRFCGQYRAARGRRLRGKRAPCITYGHSKDHRPDLKQLLLALTVSADGGVPVQFRCADGNTNDATTHIEAWETLRALAGDAGFLYVADSKLCAREPMDYIDRRQGRFVTVLPRSRLEDKEFRKWIQTHDPDWELVWDRPNPHRKGGPRDRWYVLRAPLPAREGWPVVWVFSPLLALRQEQSRRERVAAATEDLLELKRKLQSPRSRLRKAEGVGRKIEKILEARGMYPLLTNDGSLANAQVLEAHNGQPRIEKRFQQTKAVHEIAPVFLKNEGRVEASSGSSPCVSTSAVWSSPVARRGKEG
jgi:hypothetical protein